MLWLWCDFWATEFTCLAAWPANINIDPHQESTHSVQSQHEQRQPVPLISQRFDTPENSPAVMPCGGVAAHVSPSCLEVAEIKAMCLCSSASVCLSFDLRWGVRAASELWHVRDLCYREPCVIGTQCERQRRSRWRTFQQQCWEFKVLLCKHDFKKVFFFMISLTQSCTYNFCFFCVCVMLSRPNDWMICI